MSNKETDISQIRKYLNGELDARAMHELERRAQDDPFLMDALEGYEQANADQQANLNELSQRLQRRIIEKEKRIIPWQTISIAAMVLMFLIVGALLLTNKENKPQIALNIKPVEGSSSKDTMTKSIGQATPVLKEPLHSHKAVISAIPDEKITEQTYGYSDPSQTNLAPADLAKREAIKLREIQIKDHAARRKADVTASEAALSDKAANVDSVLQGKAAGVALAKNGAPGVASDIRIRGLSSLPSQKVITGKVIDKNDGQPIPGAMVKIPGTRTGTQTDAKGNFVLHVDTINTKLQIAFIGYKSKQIDIDNKEGPLDISLEASNSSLNEVVVVGYGVKDKDDTAPVYAHPEDGWRSFDKYLKANAISPDGQGGKVKLSFMVDVNGDISDITIIKGLSDASNKKAISIIEDGPSWKGNSNGKPEKVTIKIKFEKKK